MSNLLSLIPADGWQRLLFDVIWQGALIGALGSLAARFFMHQAAARAWLLLLALTACLAVPLASLAARAAGWGMLPTKSETSFTNPVPQAVAISEPTRNLPVDPIDTAIRESVEITPMPAVAPAINLQHSRQSSPIDWWTILAIAWLGGSLLLGIRLCLSAAATWRLLRRARTCDDPALIAATSEAARRIGLPKPPQLLCAEQIETPMILALSRPRLLVPASMPSSESNIDWNAVFAHELAHVARRDGWSRLCVELVTILLPLQPLVWLLRRKFFIACEEACDDWAVATGTNPSELADVLMSWINRRQSAGMLVAIGMSSTKSRLTRLMALRTKPKAKLGAASRLIVTVAVTVTAVGLATAQTRNEESTTASETAGRKDATQAPSASEQAGGEPSEHLIELALAKDAQLANLTEQLHSAEFTLSVHRKESRRGEDDPTSKRFAAMIQDLKTQISQRRDAIRPKVIQELRKASAENADSRQRTEDANPRGEDSNTVSPYLNSLADNTLPPGLIEKRIDEDALVALYNRQLRDAAQPDSPFHDDDAWINARKDRLQKRKAEIRPLIIEQLLGQKSEAADAAKPRDSSKSRYSGDVTRASNYVIEPPDVLAIDAVRLVPTKPARIEPFDKVTIWVEGTGAYAPINQIFTVDSAGEITLPPAYGTLKVAGLTRREAEEAVTSKLQEMLKDPQAALSVDESRLEAGIKGEHLVAPDGSVNLSPFGTVEVAGLTIAEARAAIEKQLDKHFSDATVTVDVHSFNSKVYYVVITADGKGDSIWRYPITGNETALDAIAQIKGLSGLSKAKVYIARPIPKDADKIIQIDLDKAMHGADPAANPQILPGDRVFVDGAELEATPSRGSATLRDAPPRILSKLR
jgi:polysaccharide biosynthesis/export protein